MNERFSQYLRLKQVSMNRLSELSCVSVSTISRFCNGGSITSDKLLHLLQACDDLSLDWLFFGTGEMFRQMNHINVNVGEFAGADVNGGRATVVNRSKGAPLSRSVDDAFLAVLAEKERVIAAKDQVITERDCTIRELYGLVSRLQGKG